MGHSEVSEGTVQVLVIGAGLGGLGVAVELRRHGLNDFVIVERGARVGGVWRDNQYPNAATDTPIELYAFADFPGTKWSRNFAPSNEILEYTDDIVEQNALLPHLRLSTCIESLDWNAATAHWRVRATDGRTWQARFVVWAGGLLSQPMIPDIPGLNEFQGEVLHPATWSPDIDLTGRKVLVVGGGATSIQVVPHAAERADRVYAMVRTPSYVLPKPEKFYDDHDRAGFAAGSDAQLTERQRWFDHFERLTRTRFPMNDEMVAEQEAVWRESFDQLITDPALREILTPNYRFGCRRPLVSNEYYQAFAKPHVTCIAGTVERALPDGVIAGDGSKLDVDTILFATGFDAQGMLGDLHVDNGRGQQLEQEWKDRPRAYLGTLVKDFPNLFLINGPNSGGPVVTDVIVAQARYVVRCMEYAAEPGAVVEIDPSAFERFNRDVDERAAGSVLIRGGCTSWYRTGSGDGQVFSHWPGTITSLREALRDAPKSDLIITNPVQSASSSELTTASGSAN